MSQIFVDETVYHGQPDTMNGRLPRECEVYKLLDKLGIAYSRADHAPAAAIEACRDVEKVLGAKICKNLFLRNQKANTFFLLMMPGEKQFVTRELSAKLNVSRLTFAEDDYMEEYLHISPGAVSILGLMNDEDEMVDLLIDKELLTEEYLGVHPCVNTSTLRIRTDDLLNKYLKSVGHRYTVVEL